MSHVVVVGINLPSVALRGHRRPDRCDLDTGGAVSPLPLPLSPDTVALRFSSFRAFAFFLSPSPGWFK